MNRDQKKFAVQSAASMFEALGFYPSFKVNKTLVTTHPQLEGEYEGEVLVKAFQAGTPSFLCMMRPVKGCYDAVTMKRNALDITL